MDGKDPVAVSPEETVRSALSITAKQLQSCCQGYDTESIRTLVPQLVLGNDTHWRAKLRALLRGIETKPQLEVVGSALNTDQMLELLELCAGRSTPQRDKMQAILVGLSPQVFMETLHACSDLQLQVLKDLAGSEGLQHHLTLMLHELHHLSEKHADTMNALDGEIDSYDVTRVRQHDIDRFLNQISTVSAFFNEHLDTVSLALALAWNSEREDLIDRYTQIKENWLRYLQFAIGVPATAHRRATALYSKLEARLNAVFGDPDIPQLADNILTDDDPSIEGLTAFSAWYVQDYWELGLLPAIESRTQLELDASLHNDQERANHIAQLTVSAQESLDAMGLRTVGDLKLAHIYSRNMLARYVDAHKNELKKMSEKR